jgi:hypothetical protein
MIRQLREALVQCHENYKRDSLCVDERDLLELFGKALKSKHNAHNSTPPLSKF